jgi:hypothetical protein
VSVTTTKGTLISGFAAQLASADGTYVKVASSGRRTRSTGWYGTFSSVPSTLQSLTVSAASKASTTCTQTLSVYNWSSSTWATFNSRNVGTSAVTLSAGVYGTLSNYVSSTGAVRVKMSCSAPSSFTHSTDLLRVTYLKR